MRAAGTYLFTLVNTLNNFFDWRNWEAFFVVRIKEGVSFTCSLQPG